MNRKTEIAWAAGLFEGEGTMAHEHRQGDGSIRLALHMTDEDVVRRFHAVVGVGTVTGPHEGTGKGANLKQFWLWRCSTLASVSTLEMLLPYLGERRSQRATGLLDSRREYESANHAARRGPRKRAYAVAVS